ncbi:hypothetical protein CVT24_013240 [Panaeolus cyanescens]|uniref:Uncharacterized protein n=1 Tax=Panaeolus cyanescens TaxID=181874 RepID=A0A409WAM3_9AGAR|nr:hypothetical protein CVT24_013240 [Panaeolus cyanescens]
MSVNPTTSPSYKDGVVKIQEAKQRLDITSTGDDVSSLVYSLELHDPLFFGRYGEFRSKIEPYIAQNIQLDRLKLSITIANSDTPGHTERAHKKMEDLKTDLLQIQGLCSLSLEIIFEGDISSQADFISDTLRRLLVSVVSQEACYHSKLKSIELKGSVTSPGLITTLSPKITFLNNWIGDITIEDKLRRCPNLKYVGIDVTLNTDSPLATALQNLQRVSTYQVHHIRPKIPEHPLKMLSFKLKAKGEDGSCVGSMWILIVSDAELAGGKWYVENVPIDAETIAADDD